MPILLYKNTILHVYRCAVYHVSKEFLDSSQLCTDQIIQLETVLRRSSIVIGGWYIKQVLETVGGVW